MDALFLASASMTHSRITHEPNSSLRRTWSQVSPGFGLAKKACSRRKNSVFNFIRTEVLLRSTSDRARICDLKLNVFRNDSIVASTSDGHCRSFVFETHFVYRTRRVKLKNYQQPLSTRLRFTFATATTTRSLSTHVPAKSARAGEIASDAVTSGTRVAYILPTSKSCLEQNADIGSPALPWTEGRLVLGRPEEADNRCIAKRSVRERVSIHVPTDADMKPSDTPTLVWSLFAGVPSPSAHLWFIGGRLPRMNNTNRLFRPSKRIGSTPNQTHKRGPTFFVSLFWERDSGHVGRTGFFG